MGSTLALHGPQRPSNSPQLPNLILENTASTSVVIPWVVDTSSVERSPFEPSLKPMNDPKANLKPGEWVNVVTFQSFLYHLR
jgi:hypothetical protein